jgi:hypothetical protein
MVKPSYRRVPGHDKGYQSLERLSVKKRQRVTCCINGTATPE